MEIISPHTAAISGALLVLGIVGDSILNGIYSPQKLFTQPIETECIQFDRDIQYCLDKIFVFRHFQPEVFDNLVGSVDSLLCIKYQIQNNHIPNPSSDDRASGFIHYKESMQHLVELTRHVKEPKAKVKLVRMGYQLRDMLEKKWRYIHRKTTFLP
jgi:hypothetical protein